MISNFSELFVDFCNDLEQMLPKEFQTTRMAEYEGRIAALSAVFSSVMKKKLLGIMKTGAVSHCHEFRLVYAVPTLTPAALEDWWAFARVLQKTLVPVDAEHEYSMVSLILVCGEIDGAAARKVKGKSGEVRYSAPLSGWSSVRLAAVDLSTKKIHANRMGAPLRDLLKPLV